MPSAPTANHESSFSGSMCEGCVSNGPCPCADSRLSDPALKLTTSAPQLCRKSRRDRVMLVVPRHTFELLATCVYERNSDTRCRPEHLESPDQMHPALHRVRPSPSESPR